VTGSADITKTPEVIRLQIKQYGKGNDTDAARLALMNAEKKLLKAIGDAGSEVIVATAGAAMTSSYRSRYNNDLQMMRMRRQAGGGAVAVEPIDPNKPLPTILERFVVIDLKPTNKQKEILALALDLQEKLNKDNAELSGMSAVLADEQNADAPANARDVIQRNANYYINQNDVRIFLAGRITKKERLDLFAAAYKRAKASAQELAEAAGCKVGDLQSISGANPAAFVTSNYGSLAAVSAVVMSNGEAVKRSPFPDDPEGEMTIMRQFNYNQTGQYDPLAYRVTINVTYHLETGK
jgi:hypothetical protein